MATVTTTKQFKTNELFALLGGPGADLSTNGKPLDSAESKEITVTVKGDGKTPITQAELESLIAGYTFDPDSGLTPDQKRKKELAAKTDLTPSETAEAVRLYLKGV